MHELNRITTVAGFNFTHNSPVPIRIITLTSERLLALMIVKVLNKIGFSW